MRIFGFSVYGLLIGLAVWLAISLAEKIIKQSDLSQDKLISVLPFLIVASLIGARTYHVIDLWDYYQQNWTQIWAVWRGGIGIYGAILGGLVGVLIWKWWQKRTWHQVWLVFDISAIVLPLAQAVGRWGNYFNQELYGRPSQLPWAITIDLENRLAGFEEVSTYHPLFLYESILNFGLFLILYRWWNQDKPILGKLKLTSVYLIGYGLIRFGLEYLRLETWTWNGVVVAQLVSASVVGAGVLLWWSSSYKLKSAAVVFLVFATSLSGCNFNPSQDLENVEPTDPRVTPVSERQYAQITLADQPLNVEVVDTPEKLTLGLSYRDEIGADGMLFVLSQRQHASFWMKGMRFNLDILWIDCLGGEPISDQGKWIGAMVKIGDQECLVVNETLNAPAPADPESDLGLPSYSSQRQVTHVLELEAEENKN